VRAWSVDGLPESAEQRALGTTKAGGGGEMARLRTERPRYGGREIKGVEEFRSRVCSPVPTASA